MLRGVIAFVFLVFAGYFAWWFIGSSAQRTALDTWFEDRRADGWVAETDDLTVQGFPNRFDTVMTGLSLADPASGWAWRAPEFRILMLSYEPNKAILVWPGEQTIAAPGDIAVVASERMRSSVALVPDLDLSLDKVILEVEGLDARGQTGWTSSLEQGVMGLRRSTRGPDNAYDLSLDASGATLPEPVRRQLDPAGVLPERVETLSIDSTAAFDAPLDRNALEGRKPALTALTLRKSVFGWGDVRLTVSGRAEVDGRGYLSGEFDVEAKSWRQLVTLAVEGGALPERMAPTVEGALSLLAMLSPGDDVIATTLGFRDGRAWVGPAPIGPAPRLPIPQRQ